LYERSYIAGLKAAVGQIFVAVTGVSILELGRPVGLGAQARQATEEANKEIKEDSHFFFEQDKGIWLFAKIPFIPAGKKEGMGVVSPRDITAAPDQPVAIN